MATVTLSERDPEKGEPVFRKDHAQTKRERALVVQHEAAIICEKRMIQ
jgi:hypothetical protein